MFVYFYYVNECKFWLFNFVSKGIYVKGSEKDF